MADVLCFGNLQFDVLCRTVTHLPAVGSLARVEHIDLSLSGNGGNVAAALSRLGISVDLAGYRGADLIGDAFAATLGDLAVGTTTLLRHPSVGSGTSVIALAPNGERTVLFTNGANALFELDDVPDSWLENRGLVSLSSVFVLPQFTGEAIGRLFARAQAAGAHTLLNTSWAVDGQNLDSLIPALTHTDTAVLSFDEGRQLTGLLTPMAVYDAVAERTAGQVVLTLGADGCAFRELGAWRRLPSEPVDATDCTGAGDSFIAGYIAGTLRGLSLAGRARLGCLVASYAVTGPGSYPRIPALAELERLHGGKFDG
ncbi:MAG TPA: carbohydrate kinase family protein [Chloroflexota bacterium]|nr:carbohydrate kinase family protein [Chloroflexota bacterium]